MNNVAVFAEILGTVVLSVVVFLAWVRGGASAPDGGTVRRSCPRSHPGTPLADAIVGGALIGIFTLVGFEAAADMAEEAVDARRTVPRAMLLAVVVSGVLGMVALIGFTLAIPDLATVEASPVPLAEIAVYWLGPVLTRVFLVIVVFSMFALIVVGAASNSRLLFAMARDGLLPGSAPACAGCNARTGTPVAGAGRLARGLPGAAGLRHARRRRVRRARRRHRARALPRLPPDARRLPRAPTPSGRRRRGRVPPRARGRCRSRGWRCCGWSRWWRR